jgi:hypothetical protein
MYIICSGGNVGIKSSCLPPCVSMEMVEPVYCYQYKTLHYYKTLKENKWHWLSKCCVKQILCGLCAVDGFRSSHMGAGIVKVLPNLNHGFFFLESILHLKWLRFWSFLVSDIYERTQLIWNSLFTSSEERCETIIWVWQEGLFSKQDSFYVHL